MNEEEKAQLREAIDLSKENNKILKGMQRSARIERFWHLLKWIVIIVITIWSYYFIQPFLEQFQAMYQSINDAKDAVGSVQIDTSAFQELLNQFKR